MNHSRFELEKEKNRENCELLKNFNVYVATDNTIYKDDIYR